MRRAARVRHLCGLALHFQPLLFSLPLFTLTSCTWISFVCAPFVFAESLCASSFVSLVCLHVHCNVEPRQTSALGKKKKKPVSSRSFWRFAKVYLALSSRRNSKLVFRSEYLDHITLACLFVDEYIRCRKKASCFPFVQLMHCAVVFPKLWSWRGEFHQTDALEAR